MALKSWVNSANDPAADFPIQNLPYGVFCCQGPSRIGVAIGDRVLDLHACATQGLLAELNEELITSCTAELLNPLMSLGTDSWSALRRRTSTLLDADTADRETQSRVGQLLIPMDEVTMQLPVNIGDYTDFYASIHHATRVGKLFRPDHPLLPNYKYMPIGYHGRASSIVISGTQIHRPCGQTKAAADEPVFGLTRSLDYELEVGIFIGPGNQLGESISIADAQKHIFGLCLLNDWSARDIQSWEYQPLGPFLAKSFATTISPWIVPMEALTPHRVPAIERSQGDPPTLLYLSAPSTEFGAIDLKLEVYLESRRMRQSGSAPVLLSQGNLRDLYWTFTQLITHHASNGCNLRPGDLLGTGTLSGACEGSEGCLLEMKHRKQPVRLPDGQARTFLEDGDRVIFRAYTGREGLPRIGFGTCSGMIAS